MKKVSCEIEDFVASCVGYFDRAYYGLCDLNKKVIMQQPLAFRYTPACGVSFFCRMLQPVTCSSWCPRSA